MPLSTERVEMEQLFKTLRDNGEPQYGGTGQWHLPTQNDDGTWTPGEWMPPVEGELESCKNGYHLCSEFQLVHWLGEAIFEAEYRGNDGIECTDKVVVREARLLRRLETWNTRTAGLFACDCAETVLWVFEERHPGDMRVRNALEVARRFANGEATADELHIANQKIWSIGDTSLSVLGGVRDAASAAVQATISATGGEYARDMLWRATSGAHTTIGWVAETHKRLMGERLSVYLNETE